ncbi:MAG: MTH1187 family thiamine-binding protein [Coriobacteriales bacterium]
MGLASVAIQVLPLDETDEDLIPIVDAAIAYIKSFGLHTVVGPFETTVEGDYDTLMEIVAGVNKKVIEAGADNIITYVKIAVAKGDVLTIEEKTAKHRD